MKTKVIPYGRQHITDGDIAAVIEALKSDYLTQGPKISEFEKAFAQYVGAAYAVAVANGTAALHLSCLALGVGPGQKVITTPITFAASANCVRYCGGELAFADIDPKSYLIDIQQVRDLLEASPRGTYSGIIPVDFAGRAVDLKELRALADKYGLWVIEDACHAPGGFFVSDTGKKQRCGSGEFADLAIFSFHPVKHIASGEGGMITTNDEDLYRKLLELRSHGITRDESKFQNPVHIALGAAEKEAESYPGWYMEMQDLGYNYRITDFQAALGLNQLARAEAGLERRREIAKRYQEAFAHADFVLGQSGEVLGHAYHLYVLEVRDRLGLYQYLRERHIYAQIHYVPVHIMPYYQEQGFSFGDFPLAERYYSHCISLPMYPSLSEEDQNFVIDTIREFYDG